MKSDKRSVMVWQAFILLSAFLFLKTDVSAEDYYMRFYSGWDFRMSAEWKDTDCSDTTNTPVYGCGYSSEGKAGDTVLFDGFLGWRINDAFFIEAGFLYRPDTGFEGQVNYPDAGENQPVSADIESLAGVIGMSVDIPELLNMGGGSFKPYISIHAGISRNRVSNFCMYFPDLETPHNFIVPGGTETGLCYSMAVGSCFLISSHIGIDVEAHYTSFGKMATPSGNGIMERAGETIVIPVNGTEAELKTAGIRAGLRYLF